MTNFPDDRDPIEDEERDRKRKIFSSKSNPSKEKSSTMLIAHEPNAGESLTTAQDFKSLLRPKKKNGFILIKTRPKNSTEPKERRSTAKEEKRKSKINRENFSSTIDLVEQLRNIIGLTLDEAVRQNPLGRDDLSVPRFLVECIQIIDQANPQDNVYRQEAVKIKQPGDLENALKQALTASFAVSLLKRFLKELPEQLIPSEQSSLMFKIINDPAHDSNRIVEIRNVLMKIPKSNRDTMRVLFLHLHDMIHQSSTMSPTQTPSSKNNEASFIPVSIATLIKSKERTVKYLIQHGTELFDRPPARSSMSKNQSRSSLQCETIEDLEAELIKQETLLNKMHEEMLKSQASSSNYGATTPTNVDKDKEEELWAQQRLVTALKRKIKQETRRLQQDRLSVFIENSASTSASASMPQGPQIPAQEVILIVNKREETRKVQQATGSIDETGKNSTTTTISPTATRQREKSAVETDDEELLAQIEKLKLESNGSTLNDDEFLKEKILEAQLFGRLKTIYDGFLREKDFIEKIQQKLNEKSVESSNVPTTISSCSDVESMSNQTVDILQELLNTIKHNNQLETKIEAIKRNIENENERIEAMCVELRFSRLSNKVSLQQTNNAVLTPSGTSNNVSFVQVTKL